MTSQDEFATAQLYKLKPSRLLRSIEIGLHALVAVLIVIELRGFEAFLMLVVLVLLTWRYFTVSSSAQQVSLGTQLDLNVKTGRVLWQGSGFEVEYSPDNSTVTLTRSFVFLRSKGDFGRKNKLLMADSFDSVNRYTRCRRQLKDIYQC